ncbi:MAG: plasminogen-binding N-terminal domain-containing protein [Sulfurimonas sp.]|uniref:plasminogen-binding N-terminal domain-containing protein n=1 Tax=Sulfurimonas sp. TaxID=2022749 RepID=UPI0026353778|nr:plasminogen-binding N-terminal domain-containing protein [Sulfurimonas sp.]MCW8894705.1 plasminogen-binding N-terminal domain-containing protein [Sulfurimonas sp.]MCW8955112.1 plasminogen-binding N-terminal domain-containing protein [Sulfurimonas sp.]MCW9067125.1 plasminogen-binding N-terminal domain-containing protein [Sulfurimonas sp.]
MKYIFLVSILMLELFGAVVESPIISVNEEKTEVTIEVEKIDVGVSGFVVHKIAQGRTSILNNAIVSNYNKETKIATLKLSEFNALSNSALPNGNWKVEVGDTAVLAFGYTRGLLIAPNEDIYYRVTKNSKLQWIHPDIFATLLSFNGHPTPLREDFTQMSIASSVGLVYIYLDKIVYTLDSKSFKILAMTEAKLEEGAVNLPFYTRVPEIDANWFGEGSSHLDEYEPHYYELMAKANPKNTELYKIVKNGGEKLEDALEEFDIKE